MNVDHANLLFSRKPAILAATVGTDIKLAKYQPSIALSRKESDGHELIRNNQSLHKLLKCHSLSELRSVFEQNETDRYELERFEELVRYAMDENDTFIDPLAMLEFKQKFELNFIKRLKNQAKIVALGGGSTRRHHYAFKDGFMIYASLHIAGFNHWGEPGEGGYNLEFVTSHPGGTELYVWELFDANKNMKYDKWMYGNDHERHLFFFKRLVRYCKKANIKILTIHGGLYQGNPPLADYLLNELNCIKRGNTCYLKL
ncbi:TPA: hypothetical protein ACX3GT_004839 [Vibrio parahaemolyticus]